MFMQQYFAKDKINNNFVLEDSDLFHIEKVMRMKNDDLVYVSYEDKIYESAIRFNKGKLSVECVPLFLMGLFSLSLFLSRVV